MRVLSILLLAGMLYPKGGYAQSKTENSVVRPKLVVGIVVDQMRFDYLYRYKDHFTNDGFLRLMDDGFSFANTHYNYVPTYTGPGHASIYTGTTPSVNGIAANNWYDRDTGQMVYCVDDSGVKSVGGNRYAGERSPANLVTSTITDQLRYGTNYKGKVIGIALKDRSAILPAGHAANAAYWFDTSTGHFITSTYYMDQLPHWVISFNARKLPELFLKRGWRLLLPDSAYTASTRDNEKWERVMKGEKNPVFPHLLSRDPANPYQSILTSPWGDQLTLDFAESAITHENLGKDSNTDFLAISFSSTDYVGHSYGTNSRETEDIYLRLDRQLASLFHFLDRHVGRDNYVVFLTADHAASPTPEYLLAHDVPAGRFDTGSFVDYLKQNLAQTYGTANLLAKYANQQVYLSDSLLSVLDLNKSDVEQKVADWASSYPNIYTAATEAQLKNQDYDKFPFSMVQNGDYPGRSGDVFVVYQPYFLDSGGEAVGTTHGSPYSYDTHVPLLFYGWHVPKGASYKNVTITDIAPTLAAMLKITEPNGTTGKVLTQLFSR